MSDPMMKMPDSSIEASCIVSHAADARSRCASNICDRMCSVSHSRAVVLAASICEQFVLASAIFTQPFSPKAFKPLLAFKLLIKPASPCRVALTPTRLPCCDIQVYGYDTCIP